MFLHRIMILTILLTLTSSYAVISIDFGSQFIKVGIIQHGKIPTLVLNEDSSRKIPAVYYHKGNERLFGNVALTKMVKNRKNGYVMIRDLIGKTIDDPAVKKYMERFPYYNLKADSFGNLYFDGPDSLYVEEIAALILQYVLTTSTNYAETSIFGATIIIPAHFGPAERSAMIRVAHMAGISSPELVSDSASILTEYSISHRKIEPKESQDLAILDIGSSNTILTIFSFRPENGTIPTKSVIKSIGWEPQFGAIDAVLCLRDYLIELFLLENSHFLRENLEKDDKFMGKIFVQAEKAMHVLSSNSKASIFIDSLYSGLDFKIIVEQTDFESRLISCSKLNYFLEKLFASQEHSLTNVSQVVFFGAGTRIPLIQSIVSNFSLKVLSTLNTDESAATGGVYRLASESSQFRVLPYKIKDVYAKNLTMVIEGKETVLPFANHPLPIRRGIKLSNDFLPSPLSILVFQDENLLINVTANHNPPQTGSFGSIIFHMSVNLSGFISFNNVEMKINHIKEVNETVPAENTTGTTTQNVTYQMVQKNVSSFIPLEFTTVYHHFKGLDNDLVAVVLERINSYNKADQLKKEKNKLKNEVEANCFSMKSNVNDDLYSQFLKENEKSVILSAISEAFDWLDIVSDNDPIEEYQKMSQKLVDASKTWNLRHSEFKSRPKCRLMFMKTTAEFSEIVKFLLEMKEKIDSGNITFDKEFFTSEEIKKFENKLLRFKDWFTQKDILQNSTDLTDDPVWLVKEFNKEMKIVSLEMDEMKRKFGNFFTTAKRLDKKDVKDAESVDSAGDDSKKEDPVPEDSKTGGLKMDNVVDGESEGDVTKNGVIEESGGESNVSDGSEGDSENPDL